jgi:hypothetical protein
MAEMATLERPGDLFDREQEWSDLAELVTQDNPGMRIGIVSGRRRHGKSYVLRRIVAAGGGLYHQARELEKALALAQFAADVARHVNLDPETLRFESWEVAFRFALGLPEPGRRGYGVRPADLLVIDELPYLLPHSPEIPSVLQLLYDETNSATDAHRAVTVVLCGSSLSVMSEILTGNKPLRGRAQLDLTMRSFDFRDARQYWQLTDPLVAFHVDAILGGTPGYSQLVTAPPPANLEQLQAWLADQVLRPASALFNEKSFLLREDPRIQDKALYNSILQAVAGGAHSTKDIGAVVARDYNNLRHPIGVLEASGFLLRVEDMFTRKRPHFYLADPIIRFTEVVIDPYRNLLEEREADVAWAAAADSYSSRVLGPHFEHLARVWTTRYSGLRWGGVRVGEVGPGVVNDSADKSQHELDVVALPRGKRRYDDKASIVVIGEAKSTNKLRTTGDLARLERIRDLLAQRGMKAAGAHLALFSRDGFHDALIKRAQDRDDVHLVGIDEMYAATDQ